MEPDKKDHCSDDEDDLEMLRLAALSSLKRKDESDDLQAVQNFNENPNNKPFRGKRRFFPNHSGRHNGRINQFANPRNSNLISIPTINDETASDLSASPKNSKFTLGDSEDVPKLILPQDKYAKSARVDHVESDNRGNKNSKFDRYDNSNSESEDDDEFSKLERSNSLDALMEELDAEISGERKEKPIKEKEITETDSAVESSAPKITDDKEKTVENGNLTNAEVETKTETEISSPKKTEPAKITSTSPTNINRRRSQRPVMGHRNTYNNRHNSGGNRMFHQNPNSVMTNPVMLPNNNSPHLPFAMAPLQQFPAIYNPIPSFPVPPPIYPQPPPLQHQPLHPAQMQIPFGTPLIIETSPTISTVPIGSLSPRSAAFVLQNRAIVEKRKRSPRRSYSRSPSPPYYRARYSKSPPPLKKRSLSPPPKRSTSPNAFTRRRSTSPHRRQARRSPLPQPSAVRRNGSRSPKRTRKTPLKERLGTKKIAVAAVAVEQDVKEHENGLKKTENNMDPVLEARKKKFESNEIKVKEGVIRLKPKDENNTRTSESDKGEDVADAAPETAPPENKRIVIPPKSAKDDNLEDAMNELEMLLKDDEALELTAKVDELFTDDEQTDDDQENEGRFKTKQNKVNEDTTDAIEKSFVRRRIKGDSGREKKQNGRDSKRVTKHAAPIASKRSRKEVLSSPVENKKIEIEIKTKTKLESKASSCDESDPEIIENKDEDEITESKEGDLRAQLSRKRAERQKVEGLQSRLIQSALEDVVFKKKKSKKKHKESKNGDHDLVVENQFEFLTTASPYPPQHCYHHHPNVRLNEIGKVKKSKFVIHERLPSDGKLPIHLRLGTALENTTTTMAAEEKSRKKSKKRKHAIEEQV